MSKRSFDKLPLSVRIAITVGITLVFALILCLVFCAVANAGEDPTANLSLYGEIAFGMTMLFCGFIGAKGAPDQKFMCGIAAAGAVLLLVIAMSVVFGGDSFAKEAMLAGLGAFLAAGGALLGAKEPSRKHKRRR